jgi:hypothetical protein
MKNLNRISTIIFCRLLENMGNGDSLSIENSPHPTLILERVQSDVYLSQVSEGILATTYSLRQAYTDLDGKEVVETEMYFAVSGFAQQKQGKRTEILVVPFCYQSARKKETSMWLAQHRRPTIAPPKQAEHANIADEWFERIFADGFLDALI